MSEKRKPTPKEMQKIKALYLKGVKPRQIVEMFPDLSITAKYLSNYFSKHKTTKKKEIIKKRVEEKLIEDIATQQEKANKKLVEVSTKIVDVVKNYLETEQYNDFTAFRYGSLLEKKANTLNAIAFNQVVKALVDAQKIQRLALNMDKELAEKLPQPIINIDFGEDKKE